MGLPKNGWFIMEDPIKMDDGGGYPSCQGPNDGIWLVDCHELATFDDTGGYPKRKVSPKIAKNLRIE